MRRSRPSRSTFWKRADPPSRNAEPSAIPDLTASKNRLLMLAQHANQARDIALVTGLRVTLYTTLD
jgi:hypothetical protein